jgi:uncharacterized protein (TIGR03905 family)
MSQFTYKPKGVCSQAMKFEMDGETIKTVQVVGGCNGNLKGICNILKNKRFLPGNKNVCHTLLLV